jgi:taurine dioxygenase
MTNRSRICVRPLSGALGAELEGVDLADLDDAGFAELRAAFLAHQVLFFRDQDLSREQHKAFGRRFGRLHVHPFLRPLEGEGHPEIVVLESDAERPYVAAGWHSDVTFAAEPPLGSVLRCVEAPAFGGDTLWASMYAAFEALSDAMQGLLSALVAVHDTSRTFSREGYGSHVGGTRDRETLRAEHPVVRTHPETGRKALFVNPAFTRGIRGMKPRESEALLGFLFRHVETPDFQCRFRWQKGSVALWDNRCTQHRVLADNLAAYRRMERVTIEGDRPY